ncbi:MAG: signal peptidase [Solirubrobacteraceae bacterium]|nr:signal peptidase [Solirubrobacteraceae bacterium]
MAVAQLEEKKSPKHPLRAMAEMVVIVAVAIFFALTIQAFAVKPYRIPSPSMMPTLEPGQRILVNRFSHLLGSNPGIGDITVFTPPHGAETQPPVCGVPGQGPSYNGPASGSSCSRPTAAKANTTFVKRVVGVPGDTIAVRNGHVIRNGKPASEPFASSCGGSACNLGTITVPPGTYFLMGDNRGNSDDSRFWGPVPRGWIIGQAVVSYWPPRDIGTL